VKTQSNVLMYKIATVTLEAYIVYALYNVLINELCLVMHCMIL